MAKVNKNAAKAPQQKAEGKKKKRQNQELQAEVKE